MSSSKADDGRKPGTAPEGVVVDAETVLTNEPGLIANAHLLGPLRRELVAELGPARAATALAQIGCLHGLRDAERVVGSAFGTLPRRAPHAPALPLHLTTRGADCRGAATITGCWPERAEARAWLDAEPRAEAPVCAVSAGYTAGWLSGLLAKDMVAIEIACAATGAPHCRFEAHERASCLASGDPALRAWAAALPVPTLRDALCLPSGHAQPTGAGSEETLIHIWGPVMVVPFAGVDEALEAVDLLRHDPGAAHVSVIVVDLTDTILDEHFGAAGLEQVIDAANETGAETVLAGVSSLSEPVVATLDPQPTLVCKDLHSGIAAGFQVAESQRRLV